MPTVMCILLQMNGTQVGLLDALGDVIEHPFIGDEAIDSSIATECRTASSMFVGIAQMSTVLSRCSGTRTLHA